MQRVIIIHYSEIGTKGKNRPFFERKLRENIRRALGEKIKIYKRYGRLAGILEEGKDKGEEGGREEKKRNEWEKKEVEIKKVLEKLPGIASFSFGMKVDLEMEDIKQKALEVLKGEKFESFKVETKRSNKQFFLNSLEVSKILGEFLGEQLEKRIEMEEPEAKLFVEIGEKEAFVYCRKYPGIGGLPVGTGGKVICSLSGGIDSPVAAFLMMKRGCSVVFFHALNKTRTEGVLGKIDELVGQLTKFQLSSKLYVVPFEKIQKEIVIKVPAKIRMIVYRRFMLKIINEIARKEEAKGIVTGDSLGQVASQTLENLNCIHKAAEKVMLAPLIGMNKEEIVGMAKKIGTYELSIQPYPDCCSFMIAEHPETKGSLAEIEEVEGLIEEEKKLIWEAVEKAEVKDFKV